MFNNISLIQRFNICRQMDGKSIKDVAALLQVSRPVISKVINGSQVANDELLSKIEQYCAEIEERNPSIYEKALGGRSGTKFLESMDAMNIIGVCSACQEYGGLGVITGNSGFGKTYALKHYASMDNVAYMECDATMSVKDLVASIEDAIGVPKITTDRVWTRLKALQTQCRKMEHFLLIIDEADKLISNYGDKKIEVLRALFDQSYMGVIIAGEPKLKSSLEKWSERFANRVDFYVHLQGLTKEEVRGYLETYNIEDDALEELIMRATNKRNGCFRRFDRTMRNIDRLLNGDQSAMVTLDVIQQASRLMML